MHALRIGATRAAGRSLTAQLLADPACTRITAFVRRPSGTSHPKFTEETVDFNRPDTWSDKVRGDAAFSCMGTTLSTGLPLPAPPPKTACPRWFWYRRQARMHAAACFIRA